VIGRWAALVPGSGITRSRTGGDGVSMDATVLVVDDQEIVRDVIRLALERAGYTVIEAASPSRALELARADAHIDLLVTDVVMPEMDAFELVDRMTSRLPGLRILYTSGYTDATAEGPFIHKPFTPAQLVAKVGAVLTT
jgi:two-component system, cell cycle sensor histidine kinase and response regulator CckA